MPRNRSTYALAGSQPTCSVPIQSSSAMAATVYLEPAGSLVVWASVAVLMLAGVASAAGLTAEVQGLSKAAKVRRAMVMKRSAFHRLCSHLAAGGGEDWGVWHGTTIGETMGGKWGQTVARRYCRPEVRSGSRKVCAFCSLESAAMFGMR
jgi:hypothetical protein